MHYSIFYQKVLPPWIIELQDINASTEQEVRQLFRKLHPYNEYAEEYIIKINKHMNTEDISMLTFKEFILEYDAPSMERVIRDWESPPLILNPKSVERVFNIPSQHAVHGLSINNLLNVLPTLIGRASQISTFTHLDTLSNPFFDNVRGSIEDDNPIEAFVLLKGRVTGKFNLDVYSGIIKGGRRYIMLNDDTILEPDMDSKHEAALSKMANELRRFVQKKMDSFDVDYEEGEIDGKQKFKLIKSYIDFQERLMNDDTYKQSLMYFMVLQTERNEYGYNELTLDKVKPLAIYIKPEFSTPDIEDRIKSIKEYGRLPIKLNVKQNDIVNITKKMR